jgi:hypothetical protein
MSATAFGLGFIYMSGNGFAIILITGLAILPASLAIILFGDAVHMWTAEEKSVKSAGILALICVILVFRSCQAAFQVDEYDNQLLLPTLAFAAPIPIILLAALSKAKVYILSGVVKRIGIFLVVFLFLGGCGVGFGVGVQNGETHYTSESAE